MAVASPSRSSTLVVFSQSAVNRRTSMSSGARSPLSRATKANAPPASMADSWAQSPQSSTFAPAVVAGQQLVEGERPGEAGLVHDLQLPRVQPPAGGLLFERRQAVPEQPGRGGQWVRVGGDP